MLLRRLFFLTTMLPKKKEYDNCLSCVFLDGNGILADCLGASVTPHETLSESYSAHYAIGAAVRSLLFTAAKSQGLYKFAVDNEAQVSF